jgi:hypothetical protein
MKTCLTVVLAEILTIRTALAAARARKGNQRIARTALRYLVQEKVSAP